MSQFVLAKEVKFCERSTLYHAEIINY